MDFKERDPTNPMDQKLVRDRDLREPRPPDGNTGVEDLAEEVTVEDRATTLDALERKYKYGSAAQHSDTEGGDLHTEAGEVVVTASKAREWGKRDGTKAVALAKEEAPPGPGIEIVNLAPLLGCPDAGEPGSPARRLCSQWEYVNQGIYFGPDVPLNALISKEAQYCFQASDPLAQTYWDAVELELRRADVQLLATYYIHLYENTEIRSLYVVDLDRFPVWNGKNIEGATEDGDIIIDETFVQKAYLPEKPGTLKRLGGLLRRPGRSANV